jgi:membrane protease YdiL (CAAX protease family)
MTELGHERAPALARPWLATESILATALALYLSLRFERPSAWLLVAVGLLLATGRVPHQYGLSFRLCPPSARVHLAIVAATFGLYAGLHLALAAFLRGEHFRPALPQGFARLWLEQLVAVAVPEEVFFRGYLQTNLDRIAGRGRRLFGAQVGPGLWIQAAVFGLCHLFTGDWSRVRVAAFGLLAGWLRARSGSVAAPILYHAAANVWYATLEASLD